ncbi:hypothetical protein C8A03DRAFT_19519, partial [Achaetomium macrosporum]
DTQRKSQGERKRIRHSRSEWEKANEHLHRLYVEKGYTVEEVAFDMAVIHDFEAGISTYQKRLASLGKDKRLRTAKALPEPPISDAEPDIPKAFEIICEQSRRMRAEERRTERVKQKREREKRRLLQLERGNERGRKKERKGKTRDKTMSRISQHWIGPFLQDIYKHQEDLFHSIDAFCKKLFAAGEESWVADARHLRPPLGTPDLSLAWRRLSDQVAGVQLLVEGGLYNQVNFMLGHVLASLRTVVQVRNPGFVVHFWAVCSQFLSIPVRCRGMKSQGNPYLGWFLRRLRENLVSIYGKQPLVDIVDSLLHVLVSSPRDLKPTLGLARWKAIHALGSLIGPTHCIVLNMGVRCAKAWRSKFSTPTTTLELLRQPVLATISGIYDAQYMAEVSLDYLFAVVTEGFNPPNIIAEARELLAWTAEICRKKAQQRTLRYDSVTRAFAFSTRVLAKHFVDPPPDQASRTQRPQHDAEVSFRYLGGAIEVLRWGDLQCRIRAAGFSNLLLAWVKGNPRSPKDATHAGMQAQNIIELKARRREILRTLDKKRIKGTEKRRRDRVWRKDRTQEKNLLVASLAG